jgi:uncharacterized membrane protein YvbJ
MEDLAKEPEVTSAPAAPEKVCPSCGSAVKDGQKFCDNCGSDLNEPQPQKNESKKQNRFVPAFIAAVVILGIAFFLYRQATTPDFQKLYDTLCDSTWAEVGADGSYLSIDTNPYNKNDSGLDSREAYITIPIINGMLGLPDSLFNQMGETSAADGRQTETYSSKNLIVTWKYHPDTGLEVTYRKIR